MHLGGDGEVHLTELFPAAALSSRSSSSRRCSSSQAAELPLPPVIKTATTRTA
jgi:hypothetical protein